MYELLKQYEDTGFRTIVVEDLREIFDLTGQYNLYGSIKQRIIDKAQRDLEKHADITFNYDEIKQGRAVHRINFHIRSKNVLKLSAAEKSEIVGDTPQYPAVDDPILPNFYDEIADFAVKQWDVNAPVLKKLMAEFPIERLRQAVEVTKQAIQRGKIKGKVAGFFVEAVRSGYTIAAEIPSKSTVQEVKKAKNPKAVAHEAAAEAAQISQENQKKQVYEHERLMILDSLKAQPQLKENILEEIKRGMFKDFWNGDLSFEMNLEKPAFYGLVATIFKKISV